MKKIIIAIIIFATVTGAAYFIGRESVKEVEPEVIEIDLIESEKLTIIQKARLDYITLDSAWVLAESFAIDSIKWEVKWKDKILWSIKDSIRIIDSVRVIYTPFFEGKDTLVNFDETIEKVRVQLSLAVKPRFFPFQSRFITNIQMRSLTLTKPEEAESWWKHRWTIGLGYGIMYYKSTATTRTNTIFVDDDYGDFNNFTTETQTQWRFDHGIQLGIYFRLF